MKKLILLALLAAIASPTQAYYTGEVYKNYRGETTYDNHQTNTRTTFTPSYYHRGGYDVQKSNMGGPGNPFPNSDIGPGSKCWGKVNCK